MARNEHKKVLQQLSEAYQTVQERYVMRDPDGDGSWPDDEREEERRKNPDYGEPEYQDTDGEYGEDEERNTDVFYKYVDKIEQDIYNGMTFKESMISNKIDPSHWNNLLDIYTEYMEDKTEGPFETGFEDAEDDAALWKRQWRDQPDVSPEEVERLKNRKPKPQRYSKKHPKSEKDEYHPGYGKSEGEEDDLHPATRAGEEIVGSDVIWDNHQMKGIVKKVDVELGMAIAIDDKGEPHIIELGAVDAILDPNTETPEEFKHLY